MIDLIRRLPDKKRYFELVTAILSIPVLLSVIVVNYANISGQKREESASDSADPVIPITISYPTMPDQVVAGDSTYEINGITPEPTLVVEEASISPPQDVCIKSVGPVDIRSPQQGEIVDGNPVNVVVDYTVGEYCAVVWSYRINDGTWSEFDDKSIALFDLDTGTKNLELRVKSIASSDEKLIERIFIYQPYVTPTPTVTPTPFLLTPTEQL